MGHPNRAILYLKAFRNTAMGIWGVELGFRRLKRSDVSTPVLRERPLVIITAMATVL